MQKDGAQYIGIKIYTVEFLTKRKAAPRSRWSAENNLCDHVELVSES